MEIFFRILISPSDYDKNNFFTNLHSIEYLSKIDRN